jgi:hypothetical protein
VQVFFLELVVPFAMYSLIGIVPVRVVTGVPELVCLGLVISQSAVCVLAQMRFLLPLVIYAAVQHVFLTEEVPGAAKLAT